MQGDRRQSVGLSLSEGPLGVSDWRAASWRRCIVDYKLDPASPGVYVLSSRELKHQQDAFGGDLSIATLDVEHALSMVEEGGYSAHIANRLGTIVAERRSRDSTYYCPTDRLGAVWSEPVGGTNGIGTAILEQRPISVYLSDHFFAEFTTQACVAAPFFGATGELMGVLGFSTRNSALPESTQRVIFGVARRVAERLEKKYFGDFYRKRYILTTPSSEVTPSLIALDDEFRIVGASRSARQQFSLSDSSIGSLSLWSLFERPTRPPSMDRLCTGVELRRLMDGEAASVRARAPLQPEGRGRYLVPAGAAAIRKTGTAGTAALTVDDCAGQDPQMLRNVEVLRRIAGSGLHVLLLGESGVGKDTLARALHLEGPRSQRPFIAFNCASVPETLVDSELFGYSGGAFTGAKREGHAGKFVQADGGTLFLDEIGDMPVSLQTRLLRVLETGEVSPLGSTKTWHIDLQIVAATHQNLVQRMREGKFRQDLFFRLAGAIVTIPALRERMDLEDLIQAVLKQCADGRDIHLSQFALRQLLNYDWPGNIRELRNLMQRAVHLHQNGVIGIDALSVGTMFLSGLRSIDTGVTEAAISPGEGLTKEVIPSSQQVRRANDEESIPLRARIAAETAERRAIADAIGASGGNLASCVKMLGMSRATFYRKLKRYRLSMNQNNLSENGGARKFSNRA